MIWCPNGLPWDCVGRQFHTGRGDPWPGLQSLEARLFELARHAAHWVQKILPTAWEYVLRRDTQGHRTAIGYRLPLLVRWLFA